MSDLASTAYSLIPFQGGAMFITSNRSASYKYVDDKYVSVSLNDRDVKLCTFGHCRTIEAAQVACKLWVEDGKVSEGFVKAMGQ